MNADRVLRELTGLLRLVREIERTEVHGRPHPRPSTWAISHLGMGSVEVGLAPLDVAEGVAFADLDRVAKSAVDGFDTAEREDIIPSGWSTDAARCAKRLAGRLGAGVDTGLTLRLLVGGEVQRTVLVTQRAGRHLRRALSSKHTSVGSATGWLEEVSVHGRHTAGLWPVRGGGRITITFDAEQLDTFKHALGHRVEVVGRLQRNAAGQILDLRARDVEILPGSAPPLTDLVGLARRAGSLPARPLVTGILRGGNRPRRAAPVGR